jgi:hypothetical protein
MATSLLRLHDHTQVDKLDSVGLLWSSDQSHAETSTWWYTTFTRNRTSMLPAGFELPPIPSSERPQTHALDRAATGIGEQMSRRINFQVVKNDLSYDNITKLAWMTLRCEDYNLKHKLPSTPLSQHTTKSAHPLGRTLHCIAEFNYTFSPILGTAVL